MLMRALIFYNQVLCTHFLYIRFFARDQTLLTVLVRVSLQAIYAFGQAHLDCKYDIFHFCPAERMFLRKTRKAERKEMRRKRRYYH